MSKAPSAIKLYKGLSLYRVERSTKWYVRVWDKKTKKYLVKSTGEDTIIRAKGGCAGTRTLIAQIRKARRA
jgi:hypothetical protein